MGIPETDGTGRTDALSTRIDAEHAPRLADIGGPVDPNRDQISEAPRDLVGKVIDRIAPKFDATTRDTVAARILRDIAALKGAPTVGEPPLAAIDDPHDVTPEREQADQARRTAGATAARMPVAFNAGWDADALAKVGRMEVNGTRVDMVLSAAVGLLSDYVRHVQLDRAPAVNLYNIMAATRDLRNLSDAVDDALAAKGGA